MITDRIKALFQFIDYLHSNIENFKNYDNDVNEFDLLFSERSNIDPQKNFADKLKYDEIQAELLERFKAIEDNITKPIEAKATELNIFDINKHETLYNWNISEIGNLKENFTKEDLPIILEHKTKYIEYRTATKHHYFRPFLFSGLDEILKILFDYFKETDKNEFTEFEKSFSNNINEFVQNIKEMKPSKIKIPIKKWKNIFEWLQFSVEEKYKLNYDNVKLTYGYDDEKTNIYLSDWVQQRIKELENKEK